MLRTALILVILAVVATPGRTQRQYTANSVLATGNWYKFSVSRQGIYKVDANMLRAVGLTLPLSSSAIRLFGNGGSMLPEANSAPRPDDLRENAIWINDGGDGSFSGSDYFLFYTPGPDSRTFDPQAGRFVFRKNLYADSSWYFLTVGGQGARVGSSPPLAAPYEITSFDEHYVHELDVVNFLNSGKEWYGEEFGTGPGRLQTREFDVPVANAVAGTPLVLHSDLIARAAGNPSSFEVRLNGSTVQQLSLPALPGISYEPVATPGTSTSSTTVTQSGLRLTYSFFPGSVNGQGWLNRFEITYRRRLDMSGSTQLAFRDRSLTGQPAGFLIGGSGDGTRVWEVTDPANPAEQEVIINGDVSRFSSAGDPAAEFIAFRGENYLVPVFTGMIPNQDLHNSNPVSFIIVSHRTLIEEARRLGEFHRTRDGLSYVVADAAQIYNEFASGTPDPAAIRDFVKMYYDKAGSDTSLRPRYLLLFGDASFDPKDRIPGNTNLVPAFQSGFSLDPLTTYTSDDFFGLLDDNEDINSPTSIGTLDLGVGRIPAATPAEARAYVDKLERYVRSFGPWRTMLSFVGDDEDDNLHLEDAEIVSATARAAEPGLNIAKIYLDAFPQQSGAGGSRYPQVNEAINRRIFSGNLIWNYSGHGGNRRLAQEVILDEDMVNGWTNQEKLPLFITATCDFAPYDDPQVKSIGENILLRPNTGGIALMTTTRLVFAFSNRIINNNYLAVALQKGADGDYPSLGDAVRIAKNLTSSDILNSRKFALLGDPALTLGFPRQQVVTTRINGTATAAFTDTLKALNRYTVEGEVRDRQGMVITDFNGNVFPAFYDKVQQQTTLANDPGSRRVNFDQQQNLIFNGRARVQNGRFSFTFIVPKDIDLRTGRGRLSFYAENGVTDASGTETGLFVGGLGNEVKDDGEGPAIRAYLNDEKFVNGGLVNESNVLILRLADSSGLNTVGTGIGHDMTAVLDNNPNAIYVLNDFYEAAEGSYQEGVVRFPLPDLEPGQHNLRIRVWDVFNNSSEYILEFTVVKKEAFELRHVLNYPNPFTSTTSFWFEHNRPNEDLRVTVRIMTITGKVVKTIVQTINTPGNRFDGMEWNGRDEYGNRLGRGVYLYQVLVRTSDGKQQQKLEKLVIL